MGLLVEAAGSRRCSCSSQSDRGYCHRHRRRRRRRHRCYCCRRQPGSTLASLTGGRKDPDRMRVLRTVVLMLVVLVVSWWCWCGCCGHPRRSSSPSVAFLGRARDYIHIRFVGFWSSESTAGRSGRRPPGAGRGRRENQILPFPSAPGSREFGTSRRAVLAIIPRGARRVRDAPARVGRCRDTRRPLASRARGGAGLARARRLRNLLAALALPRP